MNKLFTVENHILVESMTLSNKSLERALKHTPSYQDLLKIIRKNLAQKLITKAQNIFGTDRDFVADISKNVIEHHQDILVKNYALTAAFYLAEPGDAEIGEVVQPNTLKDSVDLQNNIIQISPSNAKFKAHFDFKIMQLLNTTDKDIILKYFTRVA